MFIFILYLRFYLFISLRWKQGRPKLTLRKTFEGDLKKMELTWGMVKRELKERHSWRKKE